MSLLPKERPSGWAVHTSEVLGRSARSCLLGFFHPSALTSPSLRESPFRPRSSSSVLAMEFCLTGFLFPQPSSYKEGAGLAPPDVCLGGSHPVEKRELHSPLKGVQRWHWDLLSPVTLHALTQSSFSAKRSDVTLHTQRTIFVHLRLQQTVILLRRRDRSPFPVAQASCPEACHLPKLRRCPPCNTDSPAPAPSATPCLCSYHCSSGITQHLSLCVWMISWSSFLQVHPRHCLGWHTFLFCG